MPTLDTHRPIDDATLSTLARTVRWRCPELAEPMVAPWSERPVLLLDRGRPWSYAPVECDPLTRSDGRTVVPRRQAAQLRRCAAARVPFHRLAVAHELDPDGPVAGLLPELWHGPRTCTPEVARAVVGPLPPHPGVRDVVRALTAVLGGAGPADAAGLVRRALDPIIFGVLAPTGPVEGRLALFFPLVAWEW